MICATDTLGQTIYATRENPAKRPAHLTPTHRPRSPGSEVGEIIYRPGRTVWRSVRAWNGPRLASGATVSGSSRNSKVLIQDSGCCSGGGAL